MTWFVAFDLTFLATVEIYVRFFLVCVFGGGSKAPALRNAGSCTSEHYDALQGGSKSLKFASCIFWTAPYIDRGFCLIVLRDDFIVLGFRVIFSDFKRTGWDSIDDQWRIKCFSWMGILVTRIPLKIWKTLEMKVA